MGALKGAPSNNPKGKPPGTPNKGTEQARWAIAHFVNGNAGRLAGWLDRISKDNPVKAFECFMSVVEYHIPKLQRSEVDMQVKNDLAELPTSTINVLINSLKISLENDSKLGGQPESPKPIDLPAYPVPALIGCETDSLPADLPNNLAAHEPASLLACETDRMSGEQMINTTLNERSDSLLPITTLNERSDSLLPDLLPSGKNESLRGVGGTAPPLIGETRYPLSRKNEGHTDDRITADRKSESRTAAENFSGALPSRKAETVIGTGAEEETTQIRDISTLL